jgi:hypothetical protein
MRSLWVALILLTGVASAQQQVSSANYWDRCYGELESQPDVYVFHTGYYAGPPVVVVDGQPTVHGAAPVVVAPAQPPTIGGGEGAGYAALVVAVVAVAALPVVVYAFDSDPPPRVLRRFKCASFSFDGWGGVEGGTASAPWMGIAAGRVRVAYSHLGSEIQFDASPSGVGSFSVHGLIRPTPKEHIEGGLALGYKRTYFGGTMRQGFEIGIPQLYTLWRNRGRELQLELRPGVFITTDKTVDLSVDFAVLIPVLERMSLRLGTRVFSHDLQPMFGFSGGLSVHL